MRRVLLTVVTSALLMLASALPIASAGLTKITLTCNDGTDITAEVDADTLDGVVQSVQALALYPAGLSCTLLQSPVVQALGGAAYAWPGGGFVVGGGRFTWPCPAPYDSLTFWVNFAVSARTETDAAGPTRGGTVNFTIPGGQCVGESHITTKPNCLKIFAENPKPPAGAWYAYVRTEVTESQGDWFSKNPPGNQFRTGWKDTGNPGKQTLGPDRFAAQEDGGGCPGANEPDPDSSFSRVILNGNITIHAAQ